MRNLTTYLQIDLQNIFLEALEKGEKIDFEKIWDYFNSREPEFMIGASIYTLRGEDFDTTRFESKLTSIGYTIKAKKNERILIHQNINSKQAHNKPVYKDSNHHVEITIDCLDKINTYDKWILMSGEGVFTDLCKYLRQKNKQVEIWSFRERYNSSLEAYADKIYFIDNQFYYKKPKVKVFGPNWRPI